MINIGKSKNIIICPKCNFANTVFLKQFNMKDVIICRGCKRNIQLVVHVNSYIIAERKIRKSINEFRESLKSLSNITIKL